MIKNRFKLLLKKYGKQHESEIKNIKNMIKTFRNELCYENGLDVSEQNSENSLKSYK